MLDNSSDLRNLLDNHVTALKSCSICGKPSAKNNKTVNAACPAHAAAIAEDLPGKFRMLSKALGGNMMDFVTRAKFNAQLESIRAKLVKAREEHDAWSPSTPESDRQKLIGVLTDTLAMLGVEVRTNPDPESKGLWAPLTLADAVKAEIGNLMAIKADCELPVVAAVMGEERCCDPTCERKHDKANISGPTDNI